MLKKIISWEVWNNNNNVNNVWNSNGGIPVKGLFYYTQIINSAVARGGAGAVPSPQVFFS